MTPTATSVSVSKVLRDRKGLKGQIKELTERAASCVAAIVGAPADFDFASVNAERKARIDRLAGLETLLARSNVLTSVTWKDRTLCVAEVIRRMGELKGEIAFVERLALQNGPQKIHTGEYDERQRPVMTTVVWKSAYTEPERVLLLASLRTECEDLNEVLEESNHRTLVDLDGLP